jgi:hypothetical protein
MSSIAANDGTQIYYKDWGSNQIVRIGAAHRLTATHRDQFDADLLAFIKG